MARFSMSAVVVAVTLGISTVGMAEVLCVSTSGVVRQRVECKSKERELDLSQMGLQGPPGPQGPPGTCDLSEPVSFQFYVESCVGCQGGDFDQGNPVFVVPDDKVLVITDLVGVIAGAGRGSTGAEFRFLDSAQPTTSLYVFQTPYSGAGLDRTFTSGLRFEPGPVAVGGPGASGIVSYARGIMTGVLLPRP